VECTDAGLALLDELRGIVASVARAAPTNLAAE